MAAKHYLLLLQGHQEYQEQLCLVKQQNHMRTSQEQVTATGKATVKPGTTPQVPKNNNFSDLGPV